MILWLALAFSFALLMLYCLLLFRLSRRFKAYPNGKKAVCNPLPVTVIVSLHNESANTEPLIKHLKAQDYPAELTEFILVDDRSTDDTLEKLHLLSHDDSRFTILTIASLSQEIAPKKRAIDMSVRQAKGEILLLTDADGRPGPAWISAMVACFDDDTEMLLGYAPYFSEKGRFIQQMLALEYFSQAAVAAATTLAGYPATCVGTNLAYRKSLYLALNGYGEYRAVLSGDDDLFLARVRSRFQGKIKYQTAPESHVYNAPPSSWRQFYHQRLRFASKGLIYEKKVTFSLMLLYFFNLLIFTSPLLFLVSAKLGLAAILAWLLKGLAEFIFMRRAMRRFIHFYSIPVFLATFLMHIPYVLWFGAAAQFKSYRWRGLSK
jgi:cellulose synthase/poly-beta-1,6-N-acetylglucosamine synthase-like glycosyltransferase